MFDEIKKEFFSLKLLTVLLTIAVGLYLLDFVFDFLRSFSDIIWILILGWLVSFIMEPFVDIFMKYLKLPRLISTVVVFLLAAGLLVLSLIIFIPDLISQFKSLQKILPEILNNFPPQ